MAEKSKIEWTESTWNPVTGCTQISEGCQNCYAKRMAKRLCAMGQKKYSKGFKVVTHYECLNEPLNWKKPQIIFVCSMSDLFHKDVPDEFIIEVFKSMNKAYWHTFQVLTKRADRLAEIANKLNWTPNIWIGVTIENNLHVDRINALKNIPAKIKYLSVEPMLSEIKDLNLNDISWVIVGGESGPGARPIKEEWILPIRDKCQKLKIPFFFKQWGGVNKNANVSLLQGKEWKELPI